jgi:hypothetical protein
MSDTYQTNISIINMMFSSWNSTAEFPRPLKCILPCPECLLKSSLNV